MAERDQVYRKFGEASEAAQLLETELGNMLLEIKGIEQDLFTSNDKLKAAELLSKINKITLGQLINNYKTNVVSSDELWNILNDALSARNKLTHSFFRAHNLRINSGDGRDAMMADLEELHSKILFAYTRLMLVQGIDLTNLNFDPPVGHLPIE